LTAIINNDNKIIDIIMERISDNEEIHIAFSVLFGLIVCCCSIPAFIQNNRIELTSEQKAAYEQNVRERPDEYSFNPMHLFDF
jgi:hypothetical protein